MLDTQKTKPIQGQKDEYHRKQRRDIHTFLCSFFIKQQEKTTHRITAWSYQNQRFLVVPTKLQSTYPKNLIDFFYVNTDVGSPERGTQFWKFVKKITAKRKRLY